MKKKIVYLSAIVLSIVISSCGGTKEGKKDSSNNSLEGKIRIDGSGTVYPITEAVAEEFRNVQPNVKVTVGSSGSGAGFKKFARGESDITNASRAIKEPEKEACKANGINFKELVVALDGIAIVVNPKNDWIESITPQELKKIWEPDSKIKKWSDIRPDWPKEEIHLYGPNTEHGTYDFFTEAIMGESGASRFDYNAVSDYNVAVQGISTDKYALGYFGLAYYEENKSKLKLIAVDNGNGPVLPSTETIKNGTYTPLSRKLFIYVNSKAAKRKEIVEFVNFYLSNASELCKEVGYVPLPKSEYESQKEEFQKFLSSL